MKWVAIVLMMLMVVCGQALGATLNLQATWTAPTTNIDGTPITDTLNYNLYETDSGTNVLINSSPITTPGTSSAPYLFSVPLPTASKTLTFAVMAIDTVDGNDSALSATASYVYTAPTPETPSAPTGLSIVMQSTSSSTSVTKGTTK